MKIVYNHSKQRNSRHRFSRFLKCFQLVSVFVAFLLNYIPSGHWIRRTFRHGCQKYCFCFTPDPTQLFQWYDIDRDDPISRAQLFKKEIELDNSWKVEQSTAVANGSTDKQKVAISARSLLSAKWERRLMFLFALYLIPFIIGGREACRPMIKRIIPMNRIEESSEYLRRQGLHIDCSFPP